MAGDDTPLGFTAFGAFLCFATLMATLAAFLLLCPGTPLDRLWTLNPRAHRDLASLGPWISVAFLFLAALAAYTALLWFRRRRAAWRVAVVGMVVQCLGDAANLLTGDTFRGGFGLAIASLLLFFLLRPRVRSAFQ